jgi:hypothetical protein
MALAGGVAWLVGSAALPSGIGTVVLALGLAVTAWLTVRAARRGATGPRLDSRRRRRVVLAVAIGAVVIGLGASLLRTAGLGELTVPLAVAVSGAVLVPLSGLLERRGLLAVGAGLMVLGAGGAVLALNSAGTLESQGLVGLVGGVLLWLATAHQLGLLDDAAGRLRDRIQR